MITTNGLFQAAEVVNRYELSKSKFLTRDEGNSWLIIHHFLKWNPIQNPKQGIGMKKVFDLVPAESMIFKPLINALLTYGKYFDKEFIDRLYEIKNGFDTVFQNGVADKDQNQEQDQNQKKIFMSDSRDEEFILKKSFRSEAISVLEFLNEKTGRAYRPVDANLKLIIARLKSGATEIDCKQVIAKKTREWNGNPKMIEYLRPATLFNATKFEQYLGECVLPVEEEQSNEQNEELS